jgi:hypothetical protein
LTLRLQHKFLPNAMLTALLLASLLSQKAEASFSIGTQGPLISGYAATNSLTNVSTNIFSASYTDASGTTSAKVDTTINGAPGVFAQATGSNDADAEVTEYDNITILGTGTTSVEFAPTWSGTILGAGQFMEQISVLDTTTPGSARTLLEYGDGTNTYNGPAELTNVNAGDTLELTFTAQASSFGAGTANILDPASVYLFNLSPGFSFTSGSGYDYGVSIPNGSIGAPAPEAPSGTLLAILIAGSCLFLFPRSRSKCTPKRKLP